MKALTSGGKGSEPVKRKLLFAGAGWTAGLALYHAAGMPSYIIILIAAAILLIPISLSGKNVRAAVVVFVFAFSGTLFFSLYDSLVKEKILSYAGHDVIIKGKITDIDINSSDISVTVKGKINGKTKATVRLYCGDDLRADHYDNTVFSFRAALPENNASFDYRESYASRGIFITSEGKAKLIENSGCTDRFMRSIKHLRDDTLRGIYSVCSDEEGAFAAAILCSEKSKMQKDTSDAVYRAGIGHLFAVSGAHIVIIFGFVQSILSYLAFPKRIKTLAALSVIWLFALFAGLSPSVVRACILMTVSAAGDLTARKADTANSLGLSAMIITAVCPYYISSVSFIMSFSAAFSTGVIAPAVCRGRINSSAISQAVSCMCVSICTMPFCALYFNNISMISVISNIVLVPLCSFGLSLLFIFLISGGRILIAAKLAGYIFGIVLIGCKSVVKLPFSYIGTHRSTALAFIGAFAAVVMIVFAFAKRRKGDIKRISAVYLLLCTAGIVTAVLPEKSTLIIYPDSRGYCAFIANGKTAYIFDMASSAEYAYAASAECDRRMLDETMVFSDEKALFLHSAYSDKFGGEVNVFSPKYYFPERGVYKIGEKYDFGEVQTGCIDDAFYYNDGESFIRFEEDKIIIDDREYYISGFDGKQTQIVR